jgi:UDP-glucuronate 4-epimerase
MADSSPIVVTGAAGFIGFHVSVALLAEGRRVVGLDSLNDYYPRLLKEHRLAQLQAQPGFEFVQAELADAAAVEAVFASARPALVCHLAAQAGVRHSLRHPRVYTASNIEGTLNILEGCRHFGVRRLVYASSSSVYGGNTKLPFAEDDRCDTPVSLYAATKRANELMAHTYTHLFGFQTIGLRFFTVYGRWGRPDMALWEFTERILADEPIKVFNHGDMRRDFTHISDIAAGVRAALLADGLADCEVFNLGNHRSEQLVDMIGAIEQACGRQAHKILLPMQPGDVPATYADVSKAAAKLGFEPRTPIAVGIPDFVAWYRSQPEIAAAARAWRSQQS